MISWGKVWNLQNSELQVVNKGNEGPSVPQGNPSFHLGSGFLLSSVRYHLCSKTFAALLNDVHQPRFFANLNTQQD